MTKKFGVYWRMYENREKCSVALVNLWLLKKDSHFDQNDIDFFLERLDINPDKFDHAWGAYDIIEFASGKSFDLSLFFSELTNVIDMSITCKNDKANQVLEKLLIDVKELEEGKFISPNK
jgi:hypothetical protein